MVFISIFSTKEIICRQPHWHPHRIDRSQCRKIKKKMIETFAYSNHLFSIIYVYNSEEQETVI